MKNTDKHWVLILKNGGQTVAWRDYGDIAWGSPDYTVLGYHEGTYREALRAAKRLGNPSE